MIIMHYYSLLLD